MQGVERKPVFLGGSTYVDVCSHKPGLDNATLEKCSLGLAVVWKYVLWLHGFTILVQSQCMTKMLNRVVEGDVMQVAIVHGFDRIKNPDEVDPWCWFCFELKETMEL